MHVWTHLLPAGHGCNLLGGECGGLPVAGQDPVCLTLAQLLEDDRVGKDAIRGNGVRGVQFGERGKELMDRTLLVRLYCRRSTGGRAVVERASGDCGQQGDPYQTPH